MPKVNKTYIEQKKNQILDSAIAVCERKPLFAVTMQDIINETGFSQGSVYRYYGDIDDILIAALNKYDKNIDFKEEVVAIFNNNDLPEDVLWNLFSCLTEYMSASLSGYCKLFLELNLIYIAYPERASKYRKSLNEQDGYNMVLEMGFQFIEQQLKLNIFNPIIPMEDIISFVSASYDGIIRNVILSKCYHLEESLPAHTQYEETILLKTLYKTVLYLLGVNPKNS